MGIRDRLAKALSLPAGSTTQTEQQIASLTPQSGQFATPLARDIADATTPFPPAMPLIPALINQPRSDGRADPRRWEFPVAWNLQIVEQRAIPFKILREIADGADIVRRCIEIVKAAIAGMEWDVTINEDAISRVMNEQNVGSTQAGQIVRDKYMGEITTAKDFWRMPDRLNGLSFQEWISMVIEEVLVLDALSIYPNRTLDNKNLHSLEILDGSTIKPLLNSRGGRPIPPSPAFQQILWGFPRGEFTASADFDGDFTSDDLIYAPRNRRTNTPYGFSPVERCLVLVDLYMKRLQWLRTEFTDGVTPDLMMKTDIEFGNNPQILSQYEQIMNDALSGNLEQRRRLRMLPNGFDPIFTPHSDSKYAMTLDDWLVKQICGHFGVMPTQLGMTAAGTMGETGHQEGEANTAQSIGIQPLIMWLQDLLNQLSHRFLDMPRDLSFIFSDGTESDEMAQATRRQLEMFSGQKTWNEVRTEMGLPLFTFPEADAPLIVAGSAVIPLSSAFESVQVNAESQDATNPEKQTEETVQEATEEVSKAKIAELTKFITWTDTKRVRDFSFKTIDAETAELLNGLVKADKQLAISIASDLQKQGGNPKARRGREPFPKNHPARAKSEQLFVLYTAKIGLLGNVDTEKLADAWLNAPHNNAHEWLRERNVSLLTFKDAQTLRDLYTESWFMGWVSAQAMVNGVRKKRRKTNKADTKFPDADWGNWRAGNAEAARLLLGEEGQGKGLQQLLDRANITIQNINETTLDRMGRALSVGFEKGFGVTEVKQMLDVILDDPTRAQMIAATEMARATSAASIANLKENNTSKVDWQTSGDQDVCEECADMEANSPYDIDALDEEPPLHPFCGCQYVPSDFFDDNEMADEFMPDDVEPDTTEAPTEELPDVLEPLDHADPELETESLSGRKDWSGELSQDEFPNANTLKYEDQLPAEAVDRSLSDLYSNINTASGNLSMNETYAITDYRRDDYKVINQYLRKDMSEKDLIALMEKKGSDNPQRSANHFLENISNLDNLMTRMPELEEPLITYRGIDDENFARQAFNSPIGQQFTDAGFGSSSTWAYKATDFSSKNGVILEIVNPIGSQALSMNNIILEESAYRTEYEYLIPRNQTYEIVDINRETNTVRVIRVEK